MLSVIVVLSMSWYYDTVHENMTQAVQFFPPLVLSPLSLPASAPNPSNFYHEETEHLHTQKIMRFADSVVYLYHTGGVSRLEVKTIIIIRLDLHTVMLTP